ncbi:hypothetical protein GCM10025855_18790 [Shewanella glacialipiscicola]|uniref:LysM domain-containing protein n=1 Tax=Shewanella glacialipiscicola TaxID=614069 RepID=A0ABQ6J2J5_9GAMM|nr:hypothetical protein GCM10025855_18790 [Shewanella glacialipiscicola]
MVIFTPTDSQQTAQIRTVSYKVKTGDSLVRIANKFNVSVAELLEWNSLAQSQYLQPGQVIKLVVDESKLSA